MEYYSAIKRNTFESVLMRWMNLEPIIQSEVSQKEKKQVSYINTYIWNPERFEQIAGQQGRHRCREQTCGHRVGRRGWDKWSEQHGNMCTIVCKIDRQWEFSIWLSPNVLCDNTASWWGRRQEGGSRGKWHMYTYGWVTLMYGKNQHNIAKQFFFN